MVRGLQEPFVHMHTIEPSQISVNGFSGVGGGAEAEAPSNLFGIHTRDLPRGANPQQIQCFRSTKRDRSYPARVERQHQGADAATGPGEVDVNVTDGEMSPPAEEEVSEAYEAFLQSYPYAETAALDSIRSSEFGRLDQLGHIYLDYTGGGLYGESQIRDHARFLLDSVLGNPHSSNPTSSASSSRVASCRERVLRFFNADPEEWVVVFTANASHALKLVGEAYPFGEGDQLLLSFDNHNSVLGIREFDRARGATTRYVPVTPPTMRITDDLLEEYLAFGEKSDNKLFAYPAQSNFSGVQHSLEWIERAQARGWDVLLDAAAFVPTNTLDLSRWRPDYVALSFYKMFGYPTGVGALIARRPALAKLHRPWFAGGTIAFASVQADHHVLHKGSEGFEDGTIDYTSLPAVEIGLDFLDRIGIDTIHARVGCLAGWLLRELLTLRHRNGTPLVRIYGPLTTEARGGTVSINLYDSSGAPIDHRAVEEAANRWKISLRTGCFCNPGVGETALELGKDEILSCLQSAGPRMTLDEFRQCIDGRNTGAVRVSFGLASNFQDAFSVLRFLAGFRED